MRKQSEAKERQEYTPRLVAGTCGNCADSREVMSNVLRYIDPLRPFDGTHYVMEATSLKCGVGGFAVKKMGSCAQHRFKGEAA